MFLFSRATLFSDEQWTPKYLFPKNSVKYSKEKEWIISNILNWRISLKFAYLFVKIRTIITITTMHCSFIPTILPYYHHIFEWNWCEKFYFYNSAWYIPYTNTKKYEVWIVIVIISLWHLIVYYVLHLRSILIHGTFWQAFIY